LFFLMTEFELSSFFENFLIVWFFSFFFLIIGFKTRISNGRVFHFLSFL
jgi:hypothetical protein